MGSLLCSVGKECVVSTPSPLAQPVLLVFQEVIEAMTELGHSQYLGLTQSFKLYSSQVFFILSFDDLNPFQLCPSASLGAE